MPDCAATSRKSSSHTLFSRGLTGGPTALPSGLPRPLRYRPSGGAEWNVVVVFAFGEPRHKSRWAPIQSPADAGLLDLPCNPRRRASDFRAACAGFRAHTGFARSSLRKHIRMRAVVLAASLRAAFGALGASLRQSLAMLAKLRSRSLARDVPSVPPFGRRRVECCCSVRLRRSAAQVQVGPDTEPRYSGAPGLGFHASASCLRIPARLEALSRPYGLSPFESKEVY